MTDWGHIGGDPAPGCPDTIDALAASWGAVSTHGDVVLNSLRRTGDAMAGSGWTGNAAEAMARRLAEVVPHLDLYVVSYGQAATALKRYGSELRGLQSAALRTAAQANEAAAQLERAKAQSESARAAVSSAKGQVSAAKQATLRSAASATTAIDPVSLAASQRDAAAAQQASRVAASRLNEASRAQAAAIANVKHWQSQLDDARRQAGSIRGKAHDIASACAAALRSAGDHGMHKPNALVLAGQYLWEAERAGLGSQELNTFLGVLDGISTVCGLIAFLPIPGVNLVAGTVSLGLGIVVTVARFAQMANGSRPWDFVELGMGVAAGVAGGLRTANLVARGGGALVRTADGGWKLTKVPKALQGGSKFLDETKTLFKWGDGRLKTQWLRNIGLVGLDKKMLTDAHMARWAVALPGLGRKGTYQLYFALRWGSDLAHTGQSTAKVVKAVQRRDWKEALIEGAKEAKEIAPDFRKPDPILRTTPDVSAQ